MRLAGLYRELVLNGHVEPRILREDSCLELSKVSAWFDSQLINQQAPGHAVGLQCVGLATRTVKSEHQLESETLAKRVLSSEPLELSDYSDVLAKYEISIDTVAQRAQTELVKTGDRTSQSLHVLNVSQRWSTPTCKRRTKGRSSFLGADQLGSII